MDFLPVQTNASSTSLLEYLGYIAVTEGLHHGPIQSSNHPRLANTTKKSRISIFPWLAISMSFIYGYSPKSQFCLHILPTRYPLAFSNEGHSAFEHWKAFTTALVLTIGSRHSITVELMPWLCTRPLSFPSWLPRELHPYIPPRPFLPQNSITMSMTKELLAIFEAYVNRCKLTLWLWLQLMWSPESP